MTPIGAAHPALAAAPSAPTSLRAIAVTVSEVDLAWLPSSSAGVAGYLLRRNDTELATVDVATLAFVDTAVQTGMAYSYTVEAIDAAGAHSQRSKAARVRLPRRPETTDATAPTPPETELSVTPTQSGALQLRWGHANDETEVTAYRIRRNGAVLTTVDSATLTYTDTSVRQGITYSYTVEAIDSVGHRSKPSNAGSGKSSLREPAQTTIAAADAPETLSAAQLAVNTAAINVASLDPQLRRYPYLTDVVNNAGNGYATINWSTLVPAAGTLASAKWGPVVNGACTPTTNVAATSSAISVNSVSEYQWKALLTLAPGTEYCYRVFLGSTDLLASNASPRFRTQVPIGSSETYSFAVFGDWGTTDSAGNNPEQAALMDQIASSGVRFAITTGDNGYPSGSQTNFGDAVQTGASVSGIFGANFWAKVGDKIPIFPTIGNHGFARSDTFHPHLVNFPQDRAVATSGGRYAKECCISSSSYASAWYAFDAGNARFYVLHATWSDSCTDPVLYAGYRCDYDQHWTPTSAEYQWLENDLRTHPTALKFAFWHYPMYSDQQTQNSDTLLQGTNSLEGLLSRYGVGLGFTGHAHIYERNLKLNANSLVTYVAGGGGADIGSIGSKSCSAFDGYGRGWSDTSGTGNTCPKTGVPKPTAKAQVFHFLKVTVNGTTVTVTPTDSTGGTFDVQTYQFATGDTTAPSAPTSLTASAVSSAQVNLGWTAATDNVGVAGYDVYRNNVLVGSVGTVTTFSDTTVAASTSYSYTVKAKDAAGNLSAVSNTASTTTPAAPDTTPPSAPTNLTATAVSATQVDLSWTPSTDNVGVTSYDLYRGGVFLQTIVVGTTAADSTVVGGTSYTYTVRANDAANNHSLDSNTASVTTPPPPDTTPPTAPTNLTASAASATQVDLSWTAATDNVGVTGYDIYRDGILLTTVGAVTTTTDTAVAAGTSYTYTVLARDAAGNVSELSNSADVTTPIIDATAPTAPADLAAPTMSATQVDLSWTAATDNVAVTGYEIVRDGTVLQTIGTATTFSDTTVAASTSYSYTVRARDAAGNVSPDSNTLSVTTPAAPGDTTPPIAPTGLIATSTGAAQVDLSWTGSTDNVAVIAYEIVRDGTVLQTIGTATTFSDTTVAASTSYSYTVRARDAAGNVSLDSNTLHVITPAPPDTTAPTAPSNLTATAASATQVSLSWTGSTDNVAVTGYEITRNGSVIQASVSGTTFSDTTVAASTSYTYTVKARDAAGNLSVASNTASVTTPSAAPTTLTFAPDADARVEQGAATTNFGAATELIVDNASPNAWSYLRFPVTGVSGTIQSAKLRLFVTNGTANGPPVQLAPGSWSESTLTWNTKPAASGALVDDKTSVATGWVEYNVTPLLTGNASYTFVLIPQSSDGLGLNAREATTNKPQLVLTVSAP